MKYTFSGEIYQIGINWAVDVPTSITEKLKAEKGYIRIKGQINGFDFIQTLVPVKNSTYRLFVNGIMMKGGCTQVGATAEFTISQNLEPVNQLYPMNELLLIPLNENKLLKDFELLTPSRQKDILKYLSYLKNEDTIVKNIQKVLVQLKEKSKDTRIP